MLKTSSALAPTVNSKNTSTLACQNLLGLVKNFSSIAKKICKNLTAKSPKSIRCLKTEMSSDGALISTYS